MHVLTLLSFLGSVDIAVVSIVPDPQKPDLRQEPLSPDEADDAGNRLSVEETSKLRPEFGSKSSEAGQSSSAPPLSVKDQEVANLTTLGASGSNNVDLNHHLLIKDSSVEKGITSMSGLLKNVEDPSTRLTLIDDKAREVKGKIDGIAILALSTSNATPTTSISVAASEIVNGEDHQHFAQPLFSATNGTSSLNELPIHAGSAKTFFVYNQIQIERRRKAGSVAKKLAKKIRFHLKRFYPRCQRRPLFRYEMRASDGKKFYFCIAAKAVHFFVYRINEPKT